MSRQRRKLQNLNGNKSKTYAHVRAICTKKFPKVHFAIVCLAYLREHNKGYNSLKDLLQKTLPEVNNIK